MSSSDRPSAAAVASGNLRIVSASSDRTAISTLPPLHPKNSSTALVEYTPPVLNQEEEDLEVKLRRILDCVPVRVNNASGSSAGSGSGDFHQKRTESCLEAVSLHLRCDMWEKNEKLGQIKEKDEKFGQIKNQYRQMRRKEQDRLARMDVDFQKRKVVSEFNKRREERLKAAEERTAKKRLKRQKKKQKKQEKKMKLEVGNHEENRKEDSNSSDEDQDSGNEE